MSPQHEAGERQPEYLHPRLYVASLTDYNAGRLHGEWIEADGDAERMQADIDQMLADSPTARRYGEPAEEWAIHDADGWSGIQLSEYEPLETVARLAEGLREHGPAFGAWVEHVGVDQALSDDDFEDRYCGEFDSLTAYGESLLEDLGLTDHHCAGLPEGLRPYVQIDVAGWVRDMEVGGDIFTAPAVAGIFVYYA